ncbi:hypothetical protein CN558_01860 [Bacillus wiedmannii]|uniref:Uncharacterized protein n=1 Tax=Bacillus wiedmannii TaxID=1890302 RepID=A0A2C5Q1X0_9BACI|nr:hypothetical protein CN690_11690 [Bacillus wiedmannii]PEL75039.1 hypothetical protein CN609_28230 [Bacillus wiedmannii]PEM27746.1 hypothetical protein CN598_19050 [Bacillus wiedmannii]PEM85002.1 hypothetical protein CN627_21270 [Bacillus wiedmannii]PEO89608.1 hypothetical protein CN558_01860 [Bacillus wiedmannii]
MLKALVCILIARSVTDYTRLNEFVKSKLIKQCIFYKQIIFFKRVKLYLKFTKRLLLFSLKNICNKNIEKEKAAKAAIEKMKKKKFG